MAAAGTVPVGEAIKFSLPTGEPAVLLHNDAGYTAYLMICTHQGCIVQPMASGALRCPCHGSVFDLSAGAQPLNGPARRPLANVPLTVDSKGNVYLAG